MHFSSVALVAALAAVSVAAPTTLQRHALHERRAPSQQWVKRDRVHSDAKLPIRIGLTQSNLDKGHGMLMDIADPESSNYGKHWTTEDVNDFFAPAKERVDAVWNWLQNAGVEAHRISQSANKQWVQLDLSTSEAESLFKTKYHLFEHTPSGKTTIGCDEYHVHEDVKEHVDYITPGIKLFATRSNRPARNAIEKRTFGVTGGGSKQPPKLKAMPQSLESILAAPLLSLCDVAITPECISAMYNVSQATTAQAGNELGIFEDLGDYYAQEDLSLFFATLQPRIPITTSPKLEGIDGGVAPTTLLNAGPESDLDFQISYPIIWPQNSILFQTDDPVYEANYTYAGFLNNFLDALDGSYCPNSPLDPQYPHDVPGGYDKPLQCGVYKPTNVISISYGGQEIDLPASYQQRQCNEFLKLGMQGVSIVVASGDNGVAGPPGDPDASGCLNSTSGPDVVFNPDFPATCPYLTTVGATLLTGAAQSDQETAVTRFASGGGFSNIYDIPSYQASAVANYLATANPYPSYTGGDYAASSGGARFNRNGRAYPDVSAVGDNVVIYNKGAPTLIGGTSAATPVFAAILTRINDERLKAGKSTVGFVNPTLYKNPSALHDITVGSNPGCNSTGFPVAKGWDPVTGLGTPNYPALLKVFLALP